MKKILLLIVCVLMIQAAKAQDQAIFSHYIINPVLINPSVSGFFDEHQLIFNARAQWAGFPGAPQTYQVQYNGPIGNTFGLGMGVSSESAAQMNRFRAFLNAAFRFDIGDNVKFTVGFSNEFQNMRLDGDVAGEGGFYQPGDEIVERAMDGINVYDASLGAYATISERTFMGLTFTNLVRAQLDDIALDERDERSLFQYYIFHLGHQFDIVDMGFTLEPSVMIRQMREVPFNVDFNLKAGFLEDQLIAGLSYRSLGAMGVLLGTRISNFQLFYSYDMSFQRFQKFNSGSHEVTVMLNLRRKKFPDQKRY